MRYRISGVDHGCEEEMGKRKIAQQEAGEWT